MGVRHQDGSAPPGHKDRKVHQVSESTSCGLCAPLCTRGLVARSWSFSSGLVNKGLHPQLESQELPDLHRPVLPPAPVLIH